MPKNDGGQAFPCVREGVNNESPIVYQQGMTRRQWLAGMALNGLLSCPNDFHIQGKIVDGESDFARLVYIYADAILDYEEKEGKDVQEPKLG